MMHRLENDLENAVDLFVDLVGLDALPLSSLEHFAGQNADRDRIIIHSVRQVICHPSVKEVDSAWLILAYKPG